MTLKKLFINIVLVELIGLGVMFAFFLGAIASIGGKITINMTVYGEMWPEYYIMLILVAIAPYALYKAEIFLE